MLRVVIVDRASALLAVGFWVLQVVRARQVRGDGRQQPSPHDSAARAARRAVRSQRARARRERVLVHDRDHPRAQRQPERRRSSASRPRSGADEARAARTIRRAHKRDPLFRPIPVIEHATFAQVAAVRRAQLELPEVVVQQVPTRAYPAGRLGRAPVRLRRRDPGSAARSAASSPALAVRRDRRPGRPREGLQRAADGHGRRATGRRQQRRPRDRRARRGDPRRRRSACSSRSTTTCSARSRTRFTRGGLHRRRASSSIPTTGEILAMTSLPAYDPNDFADRHRSRHVGRAQRRSAEAADESADPGHVLARVDVQDRDGDRRRSSEGVITPDFKVNCPGDATFYGHTFQCDKTRGARHARSAPRDRAVVQRVLLHRRRPARRSTRSTSTPRSSGLVGQDRHRSARRESRASCRRPSGRADVQARSGIRARRFRSRSARAPVSVTPIALATMIATVANGGTLVTPHVVRAVDDDGQGWQPSRAAAAAIGVHVPARRASGRARRLVAGRQRRRHRRAARASRAGTWPARPAPRRSISNEGQGGRVRQDAWTCATTAGSCSSRRATTRRSPGVVFAEHGGYGAHRRRPSRSTC